MKTTLVSAANADFFPLLSELLASIDHCRPDEGDLRGGGIDVCILDVGLTGEQRSLLATGATGCRVAHIAQPGWDIPGRFTSQAPSYLRALTARPFLPKYFPQYDTYIFLDADVWLQDWRAIDALIHAAANGALGVIPEVHHNYLSTYRLRPQTRHLLREDYAGCFGDQAADDMIARPVINSGIFSLRKHSPCWAAWAAAMNLAAQRRFSRLAEQSALNYAIYSGNISFYPLPAWCNWICSDALPAFDPGSGRFYTPTLPRELISILHLTDYKKDLTDIACTDNTIRHMSLRYSATASLRKAS